MKIAIFTLGTRGDVQPYAELGKALMQKGHSVTFSTAKNFGPLIHAYDLPFVPVEADFHAIVNSDDGKKMIKGNPFAIKKNLNKWIYPLIKGSLDQFYQIALQNDIVIYHVKTLSDCFADQFPHKMIRASLIPAVEATSAFPNPAFSGLPIPACLNKFSFTLSNLSIKLLSTPISQFRKNAALPLRFTMPTVKNIYALSSTFLPRPNDLPDDSVFSGFWFGDAIETLTDDLIQFLKAGDPPLLVTFGSMPFTARFDLQQTISLLATHYHLRVIIVRGWGFDHLESLENNENIKIIDAAPYDALFPLVKAVIHHGGIGTTAACLRAGVPFFVCPILYPIGDQYFWGNLAHKKGLSPKPIPMRKLTKEKFMDSALQLMSNQQLHINASAIRQRIQAENGIERAVNEIEQHYTQHLKSPA
jgi:sterol 3beta-glucosyltransferase